MSSFNVTATCPKDPKHKRFVTVATVLEEWEVNEHGDFLAPHGCIETVHMPDSDNVWECAVCGAQAEVKHAR